MKFGGTITGALTGAGAGFAVGGLPGLAVGAGLGGLSGFATDQQNRANKKAVDRANAYDLYTWDLANKYNDPSAQMKRLAAAGLNPNLVYGSQSVTGNTTGSAGSNGVASQTSFDAVAKGLPVAQGLANLRNTNSQNELLKYQMGQTMAQTAQTRAETRNLNNFLDGSGRSTYDPALTKTIDSGISRLDKVSDTLSDPSTAFGKLFTDVGDAAWKFRYLKYHSPTYWGSRLGSYIRERFLTK